MAARAEGERRPLHRVLLAQVRNPRLVEAELLEYLLGVLADDESAVVRYGQEFFRTRRVSKGTSQLALEQLGTRGAIELGLVLGSYAMLALMVNSFDVDLPPDRKESLLPG